MTQKPSGINTDEVADKQDKNSLDKDKICK